MNTRKNYNIGSRRLEIIKALYMCGVVPYSSLAYMHYDTEMIRRVCKKMEKEGVIARHKINNQKILVFNSYKDIEKIIPNIKDVVPKDYNEFYNNYSSKARHSTLYHGDETTRERYLLNADTLMFARYSGAVAYIDEKEPAGRLEDVIGNHNAYYTLRDLRHVYVTNDVQVVKDKTKQIVINSRAAGVLVTEGDEAYPVYNIGKRTIKWSRTGEMGFLTRMQRIFREIGHTMGDDCIVIYKGHEGLDKILNYKKPRNYSTMNVDLTYEHMYFLPADTYGQLLMQMMMSKDWRDKALSYVLTEDQVRNSRKSTFQVDGYDTDNRIYYNVFCIPDMVHLKAFKNNADNIREKDRFVIYCFDFQRKFIEDNFGETATIREVDFKDFIINTK